MCSKGGKNFLAEIRFLQESIQHVEEEVNQLSALFCSTIPPPQMDVVIDFMVISSNLTGKITNICTDELANLATGAPTRGHIPVWATLLGRKSRKANPVVEKLDLQSMIWFNWTTDRNGRACSKGC